jgi:phosphate starvation-inducible PhoH-like protein
VRGNEITITGSPDESTNVVRLFEELVEVLRNVGELTPDAVERSLTMLRN